MAINRKKLVAFVLLIDQDRPRGDPMKTESDSAKEVALAESDEEAVDGFTPPLFCGWQRKCQRLFLWKRPVNGSAKTGRTETSRLANGESQVCRSKGSRGTRFLLAELRGGSLLSGCRGETSGAGRGEGPAQLSDGNRHLVLGITCRHGDLFRCFFEAGKIMFYQK